MSREEKDEAVSDFKRRGGPRVMLLSIKAGNVGLNLVCANKVSREKSTCECSADIYTFSGRPSCLT